MSRIGCPDCDKSYIKKSHLNRHIFSVHSQGIEEFNIGDISEEICDKANEDNVSKSRWCTSQGITEIFYPKYSKDIPCQVWNIGFLKSLDIHLFLKDEVDKGFKDFISSHTDFLYN
jgi:hypothetical protein